MMMMMMIVHGIFHQHYMFFFWELGIRLTWGKILINHWGFGYLAFRQTPMKVGTSFLIMNKSGGYEPWDNVRPKKPAWLTWELLSGFKRWSQKDAEQLFHVRCNSSMTCRFQTCRFLFGSLYTCRTICIQSVRTFYLEVSGKHPNGFVSKYGTVSHLRSTSFALRFVQHVPSSWKLNTHIESSREKISDRIITMLGAFGRNHVLSKISYFCRGSLAESQVGTHGFSRNPRDLRRWSAVQNSNRCGEQMRILEQEGDIFSIKKTKTKG